jgi:hypothetical protein
MYNTLIINYIKTTVIDVSVQEIIIRNWVYNRSE